MPLVIEQHAFLQDVAKLLQKAEELGFIISGGELFRTPDQCGTMPPTTCGGRSTLCYGISRIILGWCCRWSHGKNSNVI